MKTFEEILAECVEEAEARHYFNGAYFNDVVYDGKIAPIKEAVRRYTIQAIEHCADVADADFEYIGNNYDSFEEVRVDIEVYVLKNSILDIIKELK